MGGGEKINSSKLDKVEGQACIQDFQRAGVKTLENGQTNIKRKRNEYNSYIDDTFLILRSHKIRYTYDSRFSSFKIFQGGKIKLIFVNLIFAQRDFVCW